MHKWDYIFIGLYVYGFLNYFAFPECIEHAGEVRQGEEGQVDRSDRHQGHQIYQGHQGHRGYQCQIKYGRCVPGPGWAGYRDPGDKTKGAFWPNEQVFQVIPGVVLLHAENRQMDCVGGESLKTWRGNRRSPRRRVRPPLQAQNHASFHTCTSPSSLGRNIFTSVSVNLQHWCSHCPRYDSFPEKMS